MTNQFFGDIIIISFKTVEAEIKLVMLPQRVRGAEIRMKNRSANGPPRVQSNERKRGKVQCFSVFVLYAQSILQRYGVR